MELRIEDVGQSPNLDVLDLYSSFTAIAGHNTVLE
jgi:hypothetical protein